MAQTVFRFRHNTATYRLILIKCRRFTYSAGSAGIAMCAWLCLRFLVIFVYHAL